MDDFLYSAENVQEAGSLKQNVISHWQKSVFKFSKKQSNVHELCEKEIDAAKVPALGWERKSIADDLNLCGDFVRLLVNNTQ